MPVPAPVRESLIAILGDRWVRSARAELETYASDGLPTLHRTPGLVVLPGSRGEVIEVVRALARHRVPFVARGAGTGLSGGALADSDSVLIGLTRLDRIIDIDPVNRTATVEPGVVNVRLSSAAARHGLFYAPDPSSQTACTLGGNIAENAGGPHCFKYGVTVNHVHSMEVLLSDGSTTRLGSASGQPWGLDLVSAFVGSEGMFGIALEITLKLLPRPTSVATLLGDFATMRAAGETVTEIIGSSVVPAALEMIDHNCVEAIESSIYAAGFPTDAAAVLLVEVDGNSETTVQAETEEVRRILENGGARSVGVATDPADRERLWHGRKKAYGALGRISPDLMVQDAVVPRTALPDILDRIAEIATKYRVKVSNVFHAGDGNLHPNINFDRTDESEVRRVHSAAGEIVRACIEAGGTLTGEHGVGLDKAGYMTDLFDTDSLSAMMELRAAFDPAGLANPGKVIPTHTCSEWTSRKGAQS